MKEDSDIGSRYHLHDYLFTHILTELIVQYHKDNNIPVNEINKTLSLHGTCIRFSGK